MRMTQSSSCGLVLLLIILAARCAAGAPLIAVAPGPERQVAVKANSDVGRNDGHRSTNQIGEPQSVIADAGPSVIDGPPPPVAPAVINRDARGNATIRAIRIDRPPELDGRLDEEIYRLVEPVGDFIQQVPIEGAPATEPTLAWIFFDHENLYIAVRCYDSRPDREIATELRRDHVNVSSGDNVLVVLDTFYDRRNGYYFQTNPLGAVREATVSEGKGTPPWNTVWDVRSARFERGWAFEMVIPFKSLRYRHPGPQIWRINFRRAVKWKNETSHVTPVGASYGNTGVLQLGWAATLVGLETPGRAMNVELKPYVLSSLTTDQTAAEPYRNDLAHNVGADFKYGLTPSLTADVTVNTDFAQVEEDLQQVNLTRFSLFFPEKRDFFLEREEIFDFGLGSSIGTANPTGPDVPILFFSRRIGLSQGQAVPVVVGGRVTGKAGPFDVGILNIQTADKLSAGAVATNFSALRFKRDIFERSNIGIIATHRVPTGGADSNLAVGADANMRLSDKVSVTAYYARTTTPDVTGDEVSYRGRVEYASDRYGLVAEHMMVGDAFDPAIGFIRRDDFRRNFALGRFSPRLNNPRIRKLGWQSSVDYVTDAAVTTLENRVLTGNFDIEFHNSDSAFVHYAREYEVLPGDFRIAPSVIVPLGPYLSDTVRSAYTLGQQRKTSGTLVASWGTFYGGTRTETTYSGRIGFAPQFVIEPAVSLNWVSLPYGDFTARLLNTRVIITPTPRLMITGLMQLNLSAHTLSSSARLSWEYVPGSHLFAVYSDGRNTLMTDRFLLNSSFAIKVTRLLRF